MTPPPTARLAFLTQPEPGTVLLNLQFATNQDRVTDVTADGLRYERVKLTAEQVNELAIKATQYAVRAKT